MKWSIDVVGGEAVCNVNENIVSARFTKKAEEAYVEVKGKLDFEATGDEFIFMPAACYDGNRFDVLKKDYPPLFTPDEAKLDMPITITDVPRLNKDGSGMIEITCGDVSVPCVGIFSKKEKKAIFVFTIQHIDGINLGLSYKKGEIGITYPHMRKESVYIWPHMRKPFDKGISFESGKEIEIPFKVIECKCESIEEFYNIFFKNRKCMGLDATIPTPKPIMEQFEIQKEKLNKMNWIEFGGFYGGKGCETATDEEENLGESATWDVGWVGGGMYPYALMKLGGELEWQRGMRNLQFMFNCQSKSGFLYEVVKANGTVIRGIFGKEYSKDWHFVRRSADAFYYMFKHFELIKERGENVPENFEKGARALADAFVKMWKRYGQIGQFVHLETGDIVVGGSDSAAIVSAGLCEASVYFNEPLYLEIAEEIGEYFYSRAVKNGCTVGGPEEILQDPDSESVAGLLESMVALYEHTKKDKWIRYASFAAELLSSWVVAYNYKFPSFSEFYALDKKTTGCVFANVQNKHAAPGLCTLSGISLYKLYKYTGNKMYRELFLDITKSISQFMSTEENPIRSWDAPKDAALLYEEKELPKSERRLMFPGFICERVNMSDWETTRCIGGVFPESCIWCEAANLLVLAECGELIFENY